MSASWGRSLLSLIADSTIASIAPDATDSDHRMITAIMPGTTTISASSGGKTVTADLSIVEYAAAQYDDGAKRYMMGADTNNPPMQGMSRTGQRARGLSPLASPDGLPGVRRADHGEMTFE